jgi:phosphatidylinositol glycan class B
MARTAILPFLTLLLGLAIPIGLGTCADRWGYGVWTFAPWNYLKYNLIQNNISIADVSPWWDYLRRSATESWPILGVLTLISFPIAWIRNPKHILTWSMVPFFVAHEVIGHKELRFLFPLAHAGGVLLIQSVRPLKWRPAPLAGILDRLKIDTQTKKFKWSLRSLVVLNLIALLTLISIPAWTPIGFYSRLYSFRPYGFQVYYKDDSLFNFGGAIMNFYRPEDLQTVHVEQYADFVQALEQKERPIWFFNSHLVLPDEAGKLKSYCKVEFSTLPAWLEKLDFRQTLTRVTNWTLFKCQSPDHLKKTIQEGKQQDDFI